MRRRPVETAEDMARADGLLRESEEKYRSLVDNIPDVVWRAGLDGHLVFVSPNVKKLRHYRPEEIYADSRKLWWNKIHPQDVRRAKQAYRELFSKGRPYDVEYRVAKRNGDWIWVHDRAVATFERRGKRYADGVLIDIDARKTAEDALGRKQVELEEAHRQLQNLTFVFAQNIQMTLRKIIAFGRKVIDFLPEGLRSSESIKAYTERVRESAQRLETLAQDLLKYSDVTARRRLSIRRD